MPNPRHVCFAKPEGENPSLGGKKKYDQMVVFFLGGEGGIRTLGERKPTTVFKTVTFNHSVTSPGCYRPILSDTALIVEGFTREGGDPYLSGASQA